MEYGNMHIDGECELKITVMDGIASVSLAGGHTSSGSGVGGYCSRKIISKGETLHIHVRSIPSLQSRRRAMCNQCGYCPRCGNSPRYCGSYYYSNYGGGGRGCIGVDGSGGYCGGRG